MDAKLKTAWIKALKSDDYEQGKEFLCKDEKYCCLGVLCEITNTECEEFEPEKTVYYDGDDKELSSGLMLRFGLNQDQMQELINMNDDQDKSFTEIAKWIKENL